MAHDIFIVKDFRKPYWEVEGTINFGEIDYFQWSSLIFREFHIKTYSEYQAEGNEPDTYHKYFSKQLSEVRFPLIARIRDFWEDTQFLNVEVDGLAAEIIELRKIVRLEEARQFLDNLLSACKIARAENAGIITVAD